MPLELVTVPRVPVLRTGHYDLETGPADFALEHLTAAAEALANDPAVLPMRVRLELEDQAHLSGEAMLVEAAGGQGGPAVGWGDNYAVEGNTLYADLHVPAIIADNMEWAFPGRSVEGLYGYTTATGHTHDFLATGLLLLGQSWPGVTTLPDFAEVQAEFAADVAAGTIEVPSYATAALGGEGEDVRGPLERAAVVARIGAQGRAPRATREQFAAAGINTADLRMRWLGAEANGELEGLPDSYDYWSWFPTETRANDDGTLVQYIYDDADGREWAFEVTSVVGGQVTFAEPYEVIRPDPVRATAAAARPRPAIARWHSRAEGRAGGPPHPASASSAPPTQEDDRPMTDAQRRALAASMGLDPETATEADVHAEAERRSAEADPPDGGGDNPPEGGNGDESTPEGTPEPASARTATVDRDRLERLERDAAAGAQARADQVRAQRDAKVRAAIEDGRITPASAGLTPNADGSYPEGWRRDYDAAPEVTARRLAALEPGKYPGASARQGVTPQEGATLGDGYDRAAAGLGIRKPEGVK